jgi:hypothetical protein
VATSIYQPPSNHPTVRQGQMFLLNYLLDRMIRWLTSSASQLHQKKTGAQVSWRWHGDMPFVATVLETMTYMKPWGMLVSFNAMFSTQSVNKIYVQ